MRKRRLSSAKAEAQLFAFRAEYRFPNFRARL